MKKLSGGLRLFVVDAFTQVPFAGNPAGVVAGGDDLTSEQMQAIAREINCSETAFILKPDADDHDMRIRFFTPTVEVPSCGHATVAAHYVRRTVLGGRDGYVRHRIGAGLLGAEIGECQGETFITVRQRRPVFSNPLGADSTADLLRALGLSRDDLEPGLAIQKVDTGNSKFLVPVRNREIIRSLSPDRGGLVAFHHRDPNGGYFVFSTAHSVPGISFHGRMFAPQIGIDEDPVTGNANGPAGAYLAKWCHKGDGEGLRTYVGRQGEDIGRRGDVEVIVELLNGAPNRVTIGGHAVISMELQLLRLPNPKIDVGLGRW